MCQARTFTTLAGLNLRGATDRGLRLQLEAVSQQSGSIYEGHLG